ncbi:MAG: NAD-dependent succinate-semialdehyde dehydrogenase [Bacteroidota bacterium]
MSKRYGRLHRPRRKERQFFKEKPYIKGEWVLADSKETFPVYDPCHKDIIARVPNLGKAETIRAIEAAEAAFPIWSKKTAGERSEILKKWYQLQIENQESLAAYLTMEQGKPKQEALGEIKYGASFVEWFAEEAKRTYGDVIPAHGTDKRIITIKQPIGVVAAITPWNFPNAMITRKVAPALAAGCTVVIKPAEDTPLSALALAGLAEKAGFPPGVFNVITTNKPEIVGAELISNPIVKKISFTGSTATGKILMKQAADTVKKVSLELGGNAPFIVFEDADIPSAIEGAIASKYRNAGQTCVCANRIYLHASIYDEFLEGFTQKVKELKVGFGMEEGVDIGPLINEASLEKVQFLLADALAKGAEIITGGKTLDIDKGNFFQPTVLGNVHPDMAISKEEIFGPVAPVHKFETEEEVISLANNTPYGLAAYFYGRDIGRVWRVAEALEYGMIGINTGMISTPLAPFGGVKESGIGREGSKYGIEEFMEIKYLCMGGI